MTVYFILYTIHYVKYVCRVMRVDWRDEFRICKEEDSDAKKRTGGSRSMRRKRRIKCEIQA